MKECKLFCSGLHKFIFIHIPKTGGTSVKIALNPYTEQDQLEFDGERGRNLTRINPHLGTDSLDTPYHGYYKFACVRNPWTRMVSAYEFHKRNRHPWTRNGFAEFIKGATMNSDTPDVYEKMKMMYNKTQLEYIAIDDKIVVDYVMLYENLQSDFVHVCNQIGIETPELGRYKNSNIKDYWSYYTPELRDMVGEYYDRDIARFNYKFEGEING